MKLPKYLAEPEPLPEISKCDRAGVCKDDPRCSFYAEYCRHDKRPKAGGTQRIQLLPAGQRRAPSLDHVHHLLHARHAADMAHALGLHPHAAAAVVAVHTAMMIHPHTVMCARLAVRRLLAAAGVLFGRRPKISVITPTWQRPELLNGRCRPSVAQQTYDGEVEHIVVSDGPDPGVDICLPEHVTEVNRGVSARSHGVSLATGDIIAYLDDDNAWRPNHLEKLVAALENVDFAYTQALCIRGNGMMWTIGDDPPVLGQVDTSALGHWRPALEKADWECSEAPPDWHLVRRWMAAGLAWRFEPALTVNYYVRET